MIDFLRANTWCSREEYLWGMTVAQVKLSSYDFSRVEYPKKKDDKEKKKTKVDPQNNLLARGMNDLGIPILKRKQPKTE